MLAACRGSALGVEGGGLSTTSAQQNSRSSNCACARTCTFTVLSLYLSAALLMYNDVPYVKPTTIALARSARTGFLHSSHFLSMRGWLLEHTVPAQSGSYRPTQTSCGTKCELKISLRRCLFLCDRCEWSRGLDVPSGVWEYVVPQSDISRLLRACLPSARTVPLSVF